MTGLRLYLALAAAAALLAAAGALYLRGRSDGAAAGRTEIVNQVNRENDNAGQNAESCRAALRQCNRSGGVFDFETCACQR